VNGAAVIDRRYSVVRLGVETDHNHGFSRMNTDQGPKPDWKGGNVAICRVLSGFVAMSRRFWRAQMRHALPKQAPSGGGPSFPKVLTTDRCSWTQMKKTGISYRFADIGLRYRDPKDYRNGNFAGCHAARVEPGKLYSDTTARWRHKIQMSKIGQEICS
jgi:hypothetical protein